MKYTLFQYPKTKKKYESNLTKKLSFRSQEANTKEAGEKDGGKGMEWIGRSNQCMLYSLLYYRPYGIGPTSTLKGENQPFRQSKRAFTKRGHTKVKLCMQTETVTSLPAIYPKVSATLSWRCTVRAWWNAERNWDTHTLGACAASVRCLLGLALEQSVTSHSTVGRTRLPPSSQFVWLID